jgi:hypothetical protein
MKPQLTGTTISDIPSYLGNLNMLQQSQIICTKICSYSAAWATYNNRQDQEQHMKQRTVDRKNSQGNLNSNSSNIDPVFIPLLHDVALLPLINQGCSCNAISVGP